VSQLEDRRAEMQRPVQGAILGGGPSAAELRTAEVLRREKNNPVLMGARENLAVRHGFCFHAKAEVTGACDPSHTLRA
jgi:hypothetical protein